MKIPILGIKDAMFTTDDSRPKGIKYKEFKYACEINDPLPPKISELKYLTPTFKKKLMGKPNNPKKQKSIKIVVNVNCGRDENDIGWILF
jgi:hypothetical protein